MPPTNLKELLGLEFPIIQGGMSWVSRHRLAAAVSHAGALGVIGAATMDPEELRSEIRALRALTQRPYAVNVPLVLLRPDGGDRVPGLIEVILSERVPIVITGAGSPRRFTGQLKEAGIRVAHVVPSPELACKAYASGVDFVIAESIEGGGHVRVDGLATVSLIPQVADAVPCPVVAAGGIVDARGILAAFSLGACGVQMGTRFVATKECEAHAAYKQEITGAGSEAAVLYSRGHHASRGLDTPLVRRLIELEDSGASAAEVAALRGRHRAHLGCVEGDVGEGILPAGSGVGLVDGLPTVAELLAELSLGVTEGLARLDGVLGRGSAEE